MIYVSRSCAAALAAALLLTLAASPARAGTAGCRLTLTLSTALGEIEMGLDERAAPEAVAFVRDLVEREPGFYAGLGFDHAQPHVALAVGQGPEAPAPTTPTRISAAALGLDERRVADAAEAMAVLQHELLPEFDRRRGRGEMPPRLAEWSERWLANHRSDFLVGVSRREIDRALGYVDHPGLASLAPTRGAVALWPVSPTASSPRLTIFLTDLPRRAGRWMVIGEVVRGLHVAEAIALRPLAAGPHHRAFHPADPVVIEAAVIGCPPR